MQQVNSFGFKIIISGYYYPNKGNDHQIRDEVEKIAREFRQYGYRPHRLDRKSVRIRTKNLCADWLFVILSEIFRCARYLQDSSTVEHLEYDGLVR